MNSLKQVILPTAIAWGVLAFHATAGVLDTHDPNRTATIFVHGFSPDGASHEGVFGLDDTDQLLPPIVTSRLLTDGASDRTQFHAIDASCCAEVDIGLQGPRSSAVLLDRPSKGFDHQCDRLVQFVLLDGSPRRGTRWARTIEAS